MLSDSERELLRRIGRRDCYERGETVLAEGDRTDHVVLIECGVAKVTKVATNGHISLLAIRCAGDLVGEFAGLDGSPRSASVTAITNIIGTVVPAGRFRELIARNPSFASTVQRALVTRVRESDQRRLEAAAYPASARVVRMVFELACQHGIPVAGRPNALVLRMQRREIASATGVSRESVSRALAELERRGVVGRENRQIVINNVGELGATVTPW